MTCHSGRPPCDRCWFHARQTAAALILQYHASSRSEVPQTPLRTASNEQSKGDRVKFAAAPLPKGHMRQHLLQHLARQLLGISVGARALLAVHAVVTTLSVNQR